MDALVTPSYPMITACARRIFIPPASMRWKIQPESFCPERDEWDTESSQGMTTPANTVYYCPRRSLARRPWGRGDRRRTHAGTGEQAGPPGILGVVVATGPLEGARCHNHPPCAGPADWHCTAKRAGNPPPGLRYPAAQRSAAAVLAAIGVTVPDRPGTITCSWITQKGRQ